MYRVGPEEIDAIAAVLTSGELFRYHPGGTCERFEQRYAAYLDVPHVSMCSSGTAALTAALAGLGVGPGMEVAVPAHTYMATAIAVLAVGAIPLIVDVDASITLDPAALDAAAGPRTRAVIPVHMWGLPADMDAIEAVARRHDLLIVEDACQFVGGAYKGRMGGSIGQAGAFSFNYFKNMTCGEGGAVVCHDPEVAKRVACMIDPCSFYWEGRDSAFRPFVANGSRASELEGAMMNVQLDRLPDMIAAMRSQKKRILAAAAGSRLQPSPCHDLEGDCGSHVMFAFPEAEPARAFAERVGGTVCGNTGRHTYNEWDPILQRQGARHPGLNPFLLPANEACRMDYRPDMCPASLDILNRTVMVRNHPDRSDDETDRLIETLLAKT